MKCRCTHEVGDSPCEVHDKLSDAEGVLYPDAKIATVIEAVKAWRKAIQALVDAPRDANVTDLERASTHAAYAVVLAVDALEAKQ